MNATFVLYTHTFPNGGVYVGKGLPKRPAQMAASRANSRAWLRAFEKYGAPEVRILSVGLTEELALLAEVELVDQYRKRRVRLYNMTDGGEGVSGRKATAEERAKMRERTLQFRAENPEKVAEMARKAGAYCSRPDVAARNVARLRKFFADNPEVRERVRQAAAKHSQSPEARAKLSAMVRQIWDDPERRAAHIEKLKQAKRPNLSPSMLKLFADKNNHPRTDHTVYRFVHESGDTFTGKRIDLCAKYRVNPSQLASVRSGRFKSTLGWKFDD